MAKIQVRRGTFETNSSSTHSICMCSKSEYDLWKKGEMVYDRYNEKLILKEELPEEYDSYEYQTYEQYCDNYELEQYYEEYKTELGEEIVAFGEYGYS